MQSRAARPLQPLFRPPVGRSRRRVNRTSWVLVGVAITIASSPDPSSAQRAGARGGSLDLMMDGYGISIGDNPRVRGIRINFRDKFLERVNGLNLTLWQPHDDVGGSVNGLALGIVGPAADDLRGVSVGLAAAVSKRATYGVSLGGLAVVSGAETYGLALGGLATVTQGRAYGVAAGGLATVARGEVRGLGLGGLAVVSERDIDSIGLGGLAVVTQGGPTWALRRRFGGGERGISGRARSGWPCCGLTRRPLRGGRSRGSRLWQSAT